MYTPNEDRPFEVWVCNSDDPTNQLKMRFNASFPNAAQAFDEVAWYERRGMRAIVRECRVIRKAG